MMNYRWNRITQLSAIGACCSFSVWISSTNASEKEASVLVQKPSVTSTADGPTLPPPSNPNANSPVAKPNSTSDVLAPRLATPAVKPQSPNAVAVPSQKLTTTAR